MRVASTLLLLLVACGGPAKDHSTLDPSAELAHITETYKTLSPSGWAYVDSCDGLLFSALTAVGRDEPIDIEAAEGQPGQWFRNPSHSCYPAGSPSDISRDMLLGVIVYSVHFHRLDLLEEMYSYGYDHSWIMGRGDKTRTIMDPALIGRLCRAIAYLGGEHHPEAVIPDVPDITPGFPSHLTLLAILVDGKIAGTISQVGLATLRKITAEEPGNPLAQALLHKYTDGDQSLATSELLMTWPHDRLPTNEDWCEEWRLQRADNDPSLQPCSTTVTHSGGDLLLVSSIIEEAY